MLEILIGQEGSLENVVMHFGDRVKKVLQLHSYFLSGNKTKFIDISTVLKMIPIHWVANEIVSVSGLAMNTESSKPPSDQAGIPLKGKDNPDAEWTDEELFKMLGQIYE